MSLLFGAFGRSYPLTLHRTIQGSGFTDLKFRALDARFRAKSLGFSLEFRGCCKQKFPASPTSLNKESTPDDSWVSIRSFGFKELR